MKQIKELQTKLKTATEKEQIKLLLGFSDKQKKQLENEIKQLKKKNKELQKDKEKFQAIAERTSDIITISTLALNPKQIYVSPSIKHGLGYKPEELIGKPFFEFVHPDDKKMIFPLLKKYIQNFAKKILKIGDPSITETIDFRLKNKAGKWRNMQSTINFFGKNLLSVTRDITESKRAEDALKESEAKLRLMIDNSPVGFSATDLKGNYIDINPAFSKMLGYSREEMLYKHFNQFSHVDDRTKNNKLFEGLVDGELSYFDLEKRYLHKNGDIVFVNMRSQIVKDKEGKSLFEIAIIENITERKQIQKKLLQNQYLLSKAQEIGKVGSWELDIQNGDLKWTDETYNIFDIPIGTEMTNELFMGCVHPDDRDYLNKSFNNALLEIEPFDIEHRIIVNNNIKWLNEKADIKFDAKGNPVIANGFVQDITDRKKAEEELKKGKDLLNATQLLSRVGGWKWNVEKQIMNWTDETFLIHELDQTVIGADFNKYIEKSLLCYEKKDRKLVMDSFQKCVDSGESYDMEFPFTTFKGNRIWIRTTAKAEKENGKVVNVIGNIMDITERKKAEEELKNSEEKFKMIFESAPDAYYLNDSKGIFIDGNKAAEKLLGYKKEELIGKSLLKLKLTSAKDLPKASKVLLANIQGKSSGPDEFVLNRKDGKQVSVEVTTHPAKIKNESVVLGIAHDITKRKQAEDELREAKEFAENLLETANSIVVILDVNANIVTFNRYAEKLSGYKKNEVLGKNWFDLFIPSEDKQKIPDVFIKALQSMPEASQNENEILQKNGEKIVINWNNNVIHNNYGDISGILSIGVDVTERNRARDELKKYAETQKVLLREVNHRVKNNLSALISMLHKGQDHAEEKGLDSSTVLAIMEERINGLANVHSLLSESEWKPIKLSVLCKQIVGGSMSNLLLTGKVKLIVNRSELMIDSDKAHHLTMVLNELAINTLKYALAKRDIVTITIDFKKNKDKIEMCFCDDGPGYPKKLLKGDISDIGVGFELIRGIVMQSMGGDLQITNDNGAKTTITFKND